LDAVIDDGVYATIEFGAMALCAARAMLVRDERLAWALLAGFCGLWAAGDLAWTLDLNHRAVAPYPNYTDAIYLVSYGCAYGGLMALLRSRLRPFPLSLWLDGLVGGLSLAALYATLVFGPIMGAATGSQLTVAITLAYPACDLLLLCFVGVTFGLSGWRPGPASCLIGVSLLVTAIGDAAYGWAQATGDFPADGIIDSLWPIATLVLAAAAWQPRHRGTVRGDGMIIILVPGVFALLALGVLLFAQVHEVPLAAAALAGLTLVAAGARATLTFRENVSLLRASRGEALTDGLTGLRNRRALVDDLDNTLAVAREDAPVMLAFFDLDGFKAYNDSFGHTAGDALLTRLGRGLDELAVAAGGRAYRPGGDEFCLIFTPGPRGADEALRQAVSALSASGEGFQIGASYGTVLIPTEASTATLALQIADERMYRHKDGRRGSPRREARDLLMQVLKEREPELEQHLGEVGILARAVARRLGVTAEELDEITRAAELHDVGKLAVPDTILHKPGPLDELEWTIMRQHTIVGERILSASPALLPVARLVRSSHEQWDGTGYPDGLAGAAIPLGARVVAACDAFHAMTEDRAYARRKTMPAAIAELSRCAGTQFDPLVVRALCDVVAHHGASLPAGHADGR
jgi:diguanylate cyclase (GGDEF)-like protein